MGLKDGKLRILPLPYREHYYSDPIVECNLPNKVFVRYISVWNEDKEEWQVLQCNQKLYEALETARAALKAKYPFCREPIVVIKGTAVRVKQG